MAKSCSLCGNKEDHYGKGTLPVKLIGGVGNVCSDCSEGSSDKELRENKHYNDALMRGIIGPKAPKEPEPRKGGTVSSSGVCRNCNTLKTLSGTCEC
jgi:hypothetical protein